MLVNAVNELYAFPSLFTEKNSLEVLSSIYSTIINRRLIGQLKGKAN